MIAVVTVLLALPLGLLVPSRDHAVVAYVAAYLWAFCFQGVSLVLDAMAGSRDAFTPGGLPWSYGVVSLAVLGVGLALVEAGHRLGARRRERLVV
ncbi:MAG: hypothetical protein Q7T56_05275 [Nocardioidaceae bacterium]|nr:hypothetical protein [Nocardioidaceae bacterium]